MTTRHRFNLTDNRFISDSIIIEICWRSFSEVRPRGLGDVIIETELLIVVLGADLLRVGCVHKAEAAHARPWLSEGVRIVNGELSFQKLAVLDHAVAFHDVQLFG